MFRGDVNSNGSWAKGLWELSVLSLQFSCECKIISKNNLKIRGQRKSDKEIEKNKNDEDKVKKKSTEMPTFGMKESSSN